MYQSDDDQNKEDAELVREIRQALTRGERERAYDVFRVLHDRHARFVHEKSRRWLQKARRLWRITDSQDVASVAMIRAWMAVRDGRIWTDDSLNYRAWISTIIKNEVVDLIRKQNREGQTPLPESRRVQLSPERKIDLEKAIEHLPDQQRKAIGFRLKGMSYPEIAKNLRVEEKTARSHVRFAKEALKKRLGND